MEGEAFLRRQWGVGKGDEQREEMNLTKEMLPKVRRETPPSPTLPISAGPLLEGLHRGGQIEVFLKQRMGVESIDEEEAPWGRERGD